MPRANSHTANLPLTMAESVKDQLEAVPGARTAFLKYSRKNESFKVESYLINDPTIDRLRAPSSSTYDTRYLEVGTYTRGVSTRDLAEDINDTMARVR